jgi:hypothetical protein
MARFATISKRHTPRTLNSVSSLNSIWTIPIIKDECTWGSNHMDRFLLLTGESSVLSGKRMFWMEFLVLEPASNILYDSSSEI